MQSNLINVNRQFANSKDENKYLEKNPHEYILYALPEIKEAIKNVGAKVVNLDLYYEELSFMNKTNIDKFLTNNTPEPIFVSFNKEEETPVLIVRYIDEINNKLLGVENASGVKNATSFVCIMLIPIAHIGLEPMAFECGPGRSKKGHIKMKSKSNVNLDMKLDGGHSITKYVVDLIEGKLEGKRIR